MFLKNLSRAAVLLILILAMLPVERVQAGRGMPGTGQFGYGVRISLNDSNLNQTLTCVSKLALDWILVDLAWDEFVPREDTAPNWAVLDQVMSFAAGQYTPVIISLSRPPAWALSEHGPDSTLTFQWISTLVNRYQETLQAVEVFAGANTRKGWGAKPASKAYAKLFMDLQQQITAQGLAVTLVAGGLVPVTENDPENRINDLKFLQGLYDNGLKDYMPVISLQMAHTTAAPLTTPDGQEFRYLRHYEEIRQVMLNNGHSGGLLWITRLARPDGTITPSDQVYLSSENAGQWLSQTLAQLKSQLYLGIAVLDILQPGSNPLPVCEIHDTASLLANPNSQTKDYKFNNHPLKLGRPKSHFIGKGEPPA